MRRSLILAGTIAVISASPAFPAPDRYAISDTQIAAAISNAGMPVRPEDVTPLARVVATVPFPQLNIRSVERTWGDRIMVRMECGGNQECLPFLVSLHVSREIADRLAAVHFAAPESVQSSESRQVAIRNGSRAILLLDSEHVHIRIPVISLESGMVGQRIRVTDKDSHQVYSALVVDRGLLQGRL